MIALLPYIGYGLLVAFQYFVLIELYKVGSRNLLRGLVVSVVFSSLVALFLDSSDDLSLGNLIVCLIRQVDVHFLAFLLARFVTRCLPECVE